MGSPKFMETTNCGRSLGCGISGCMIVLTGLWFAGLRSLKWRDCAASDNVWYSFKPPKARNKKLALKLQIRSSHRLAP